MMNLADRCIEFLEKRGLRIDWPAFARIMLVGLLAVMTLSWIMPDRARTPDESAYARQIDSPFVHEVGAARGDERGFFPSPTGPDQFRIAWITGSSVQGVDPTEPTFAPDKVRARLPKIDGRDVVIDIYFLSGIRIVDELIAVEMALDSHPDMIVVTLNPVWVLNDRAVHGWSNLDGRWFAASVLSPPDWPLTMSFVGPSSAAWGVLGSRVKMIDDRYDWGVSMKKNLGSWSPLDVDSPPPQGVEDPLPELQRIAEMQIPVLFWNDYSWVYDATSRPDPAAQATVFNYEADHASGIPGFALNLMFEKLAKSNVPSLVYLAQINDVSVSTLESDLALGRVEAKIAETAANHPSANLRVVPESAIRSIGHMDFRDNIHAFNIDPLVDYLTPLICEFLTEQQLESSCGS